MTTQTERVDVLARTFVLPTKPLSLVDAINRMALATGCHRNAMRGRDADFNGHCIRVWWNSYREYWIADYTWGGQQVIARGSLEACVKVAARFYEGEGRGASASVEVETIEDAAVCIAAGFIAAEDEDCSWRDWRFDEVASAVSMERRGFGQRTAYLLQAKSRSDYDSLCSAGFRTSSVAVAALARIGGDL